MPPLADTVNTSSGTASAGRCRGTVGRRFDVVSPVVGLLATTVALKNSRAPVRTDTGRKREVDLSTHVVESNQLIESRQLEEPLRSSVLLLRGSSFSRAYLSGRANRDESTFALCSTLVSLRTVPSSGLNWLINVGIITPSID